MNRNLYLTGFMGAGKTTLGRELARLLGRRFADLDQNLERRLGMPIAQVFAQEGEEAFRRAETAELKRLAARRGLVVAVGGGLPTRRENRELMRSSGRIIHLAADLDQCRRRLGPEGRARRPLWQDPSAVERLFNQRRRAYADRDLRLEIQDRAPARLAEEVCGWLLPDDEFSVSLDGEDCPVTGSFAGPRVLADWAGGRRVVLLCDRNLARLHLERYREVLNDPLVIVLPPGEGSKTLNGARKIYRAMLEARVERGDLLIALGGGVITDLGAFAAATYKRGMDFALVSTSLLGCVDAAVGGKAAVNLDHTKNTVGCFTRPLGVILDLRALGTLARRHRAEGAVEAYKTGLAADGDLAAFVRDYLQPILAGDLPAMARAAGLSARVKARVVSRDFREAGLRRILNLGHTYGHAVEGVNRFRVSHGRAVAAGIMAAAAVSQGRGLLDDEAADEIMRAMKPLAPKPDKWPEAREAWRIMVHDKKNQNRRVLYVLLEEPGRAIWVDDVGPDELQRALERMEGV